MQGNVLREIVVFIAVGGTSALCYTAIGAFCTSVGMHPSMAIIVALAVLIPPTYLAQRRLAFRSERRHMVALPRYIGTQLFGNSLGLIGTVVFSSAITKMPLLAFAIIAVVVAAANYLCLKFWAFGSYALRSS